MSTNTRFALHFEGGERSAEAFLAAFLPAAGTVLAAHLGTEPSWPVHVVLSDRATHEQRFPPRAEELIDLIEPSEAADAGKDSRRIEAERERYPPSTYAHGVATRVDASHKPPPTVVLGQLAIYLDIESIAALAADMDVLLEGMLGRVAIHELSHVFRGHADDADSATHGWLAEGDAQRDAWEVLIELLRDREWPAVARWGRIAQVRLAGRQPPAYSRFGLGGADRAALLHDQVIEPPASWVVKPPRRVFRLVHQGATEIPVSTMLRSPATADHVYLRDSDMVAGPWVVSARCAVARVAHLDDRRAVQHEAADHPGGEGRITWLQLRPIEPLAAGVADDAIPSPARLAAEAVESEAKMAKHLTADAVEMAEALADADAADWRAVRDQLNLRRRETGAPLIPFMEYDPFCDWR